MVLLQHKHFPSLVIVYICHPAILEFHPTTKQGLTSIEHFSFRITYTFASSTYYLQKLLLCHVHLNIVSIVLHYMQITLCLLQGKIEKKAKLILWRVGIKDKDLKNNVYKVTSVRNAVYE